MDIQTISPSCSLDYTTRFLSAVQQAPSSLPTVLALLLCIGVGTYAVKSLYGRCCAQPQPAPILQIAPARPAPQRASTDASKRIETDRAARAAWHGADIAKRVEALRLFGSYLVRGSHLAEGIPMIEQAIISKHEQIRFEGCQIFKAVFIQNIGYLEAITSIMDGFTSADPQVHQASDLSLNQLFTSQTLLPLLHNHIKELRRTHSETQIKLLALKIYTIAVKGASLDTIPIAFTRAKHALKDKDPLIRAQAVKILAILLQKNYKCAEIREICTTHQAPELASLRQLLPPETPSARQRTRARLEEVS